MQSTYVMRARSCVRADPIRQKCTMSDVRYDVRLSFFSLARSKKREGSKQTEPKFLPIPIERRTRQGEKKRAGAVGLAAVYPPTLEAVCRRLPCTNDMSKSAVPPLPLPNLPTNEPRYMFQDVPEADGTLQVCRVCEKRVSPRCTAFVVGGA